MTTKTIKTDLNSKPGREKTKSQKYELKQTNKQKQQH